MRIRPSRDRAATIRAHARLASLAITAVLAARATAGAVAPTPDVVTQGLSLTRVSLQRLRPTAARTEVIALDLEGRHVTVRLERASLRASGFRVRVAAADGTLHDVDPPAPATYHGTVDEAPGSIAGGVIRDGHVWLTIALADGPVYTVQPVSDVDREADPALHAVYPGDAATASGTCTVDEPPVAVPPRGPVPEAALGTGPRIAELAIDADYELYLLEGSTVTATVNDVENVMSGVNVVYERDCNLTHRLVTIIVRSAEPDPYSTTSPDTLLTQMRTHWNASQAGVHRDLAHLMTGKDLNGGVIGIASVGVVCSSNRGYGLSQTRFTSNMSRRVALTAHELGHNWNADHCDGATPCNIMCSSINGCSGIGLPNFEPMGIDAITSYAATRSCLDTPPLAVSDPATTGAIRLAAQPTPFVGQTRITYSIGEAAPVRLGIYDVAGHRVAALVEAVESPGAHTVVWDGRDARGARLEPGVFYARLETRGTALTRTLVLIH